MPTFVPPTLRAQPLLDRPQATKKIRVVRSSYCLLSCNIITLLPLLVCPSVQGEYTTHAMLAPLRQVRSISLETLDVA